MSGERAPPLGLLLLRGSRSKSYGSLFQSPRSPVRQRRLEHTVQAGETIQGLALKYGVSMEEIKRANRLYTNDSIFLKKSLLIPVLSDCSDTDGGQASAPGDRKQDEGEGRAPSDLSPVDFLKRLDDLIGRSKQAAVKGCDEAEKRVAALEAACSSSRAPDRWRLTRSQSVVSSPRMHQQPLTNAKLAQKLREREDEIFEL